MNKKLIFTIIFIVVIILGMFVWLRGRGVQDKKQVFKTQEECEETTGMKCSFEMCDYKCPKDFVKGWASISEGNTKNNQNELVCNDSDNGKDIYVKGSATTKQGEQTLHVNADSCAIKDTQYGYGEGNPSCSGDNCYVHEGYCGEYKGSPLDMSEFIQCPNGCNDGACLLNNKNDIPNSKFIDNTTSKEIACTKEQRGAEVCAEIYAPVCATVEIQCIKAPCNPVKQTFSNTCEACKNSLVKSYVNGECKSNN